jgi:hypothetical protein
MATKIWEDWKIEDGDYVADSDNPQIMMSENVRQKIAVSVGLAVFCVAIVALITL